MSEDRVPYGEESKDWERDAQELRALMEAAGYSQIAAAKELDVSERAVRGYCSGREPVPRAVLYAMRWLVDHKPNQEQWLQVHWKKLGMTVKATDKFECEFDGQVLRVRHNDAEAVFGNLERLASDGYISLHTSYSSDRFRLVITPPKPATFQTEVRRDLRPR